MRTQIIQLSRQHTLEQDTLTFHEWIKHRLEGSEIDLTNLLRWEDDGGVIVQTVEATCRPESEDISRGNPIKGFITNIKRSAF